VLLSSPWYQSTRGCQADAVTPPSADRWLLVDALLNVHYFSYLYGKSTYMFDARPSLRRWGSESYATAAIACTGSFQEFT
jgi:hypothetical protein